MLLVFVPASVLFGVFLFLFLISRFGRRFILITILFSSIPVGLYVADIVAE